MEQTLILVNDITNLGAEHIAIEQVINIGQLHIPSGKIVVCDPLSEPEAAPLLQDFPMGAFPVNLYLNKDENTISFAEIRFSSRPPVRWELALCKGQELSELGEDEIYGYPVDAGMACFMDSNAQKLMLTHEVELSKKLGKKFVGYYEDCLDALFFGPDAKSDTFAMHKPYPERPNNIALFQSGYGDGFFASYIGFDSDGKPVRLVTDFAVIE